jgi:hypothetical protein
VQGRILGLGQALVEYVVADEGVFAFVVTRDSCRFFRLDTDRGALAQQIEKLLEPIRKLRQSQTDLLHIGFDIDMAHRLYTILFER